MIQFGDISRAAWHESVTVRRILERFAARGFPTARSVRKRGIWSDAPGHVYDREHPGVAALMAVRALWFELLGDCGGTSTDELIDRHRLSCAWEQDFHAAIAAMRLDFPPYGEDAGRAARAGDRSISPAVAARAFVETWEQARQARVARFHAEREQGA